MKNMWTLKLSLLAGAAVGLSGCRSIEGQLQVSQPVEAYKKAGDARTRFVIPAGNYQTLVTGSGRSLRVKLVASNGQKFQFSAKSPVRGAVDSNFEASPAQLGQPFAMSFKREETVLSRGGVRTEARSCVLYSRPTTRRECRQVQVPGPGERRICEAHPVFPNQESCRYESIIGGGSTLRRRAGHGICLRQPQRHVPTQENFRLQGAATS